MSVICNFLFKDYTFKISIISPRDQCFKYDSAGDWLWPAENVEGFPSSWTISHWINQEWRICDVGWLLRMLLKSGLDYQSGRVNSLAPGICNVAILKVWFSNSLCNKRKKIGGYNPLAFCCTTPYIASGNSLLPNGTGPLLEPKLSYCQLDP